MRSMSYKKYLNNVIIRKSIKKNIHCTYLLIITTRIEETEDNSGLVGREKIVLHTQTAATESSIFSFAFDLAFDNSNFLRFRIRNFFDDKLRDSVTDRNGIIFLAVIDNDDFDNTFVVVVYRSAKNANSELQSQSRAFAYTSVRAWRA